MTTTSRPLRELTAEDLMTRTLVRLPEGMPLREAARLLLRNRVGGAPVVDAQGKCIGVLSAIDFLRFAERRPEAPRPTAAPLPVSCSFQAKHWTEDGKDVTLCLLPPGVCPIQMQRTGPAGADLLICTEPHCVFVDWQHVDIEKVPDAEVRQFMSADPITVRTDTAIRTLARMMLDAHIHRIIVIDAEHRPVGIVSSTDLLAVLAYVDDVACNYQGAIDSDC